MRSRWGNFTRRRWLNLWASGNHSGVTTHLDNSWRTNITLDARSRQNSQNLPIAKTGHNELRRWDPWWLKCTIQTRQMAPTNHTDRKSSRYYFAYAQSGNYSGGGRGLNEPIVSAIDRCLVNRTSHHQRALKKWIRLSSLYGQRISFPLVITMWSSVIRQAWLRRGCLPWYV